METPKEVNEDIFRWDFQSTPIPTWKLLGEICRPFFLKTWSQPLARVTSTSAQALERVGFFGGSWRCDQTWQWNIPIFRVQIIYLGKCYSLVSYHFGIFFWVGRSDFAIWMTGGKLSKSACCRPRPDTSGNTVQPHKAQNHPREEEWKLMGTSPFWMDGMDTVNGSPSSASSKAQSTKIHEIMGIQLWFPTDLSLI